MAALCVVLASAPSLAAAMPAPDPPPSAVTPDPPPEAVEPRAPVKAVTTTQLQIVRTASRPAAPAPIAPRQQTRVRAAATRTKVKPKPQVVKAQAVARDSAPMPRRPATTVMAVERGLLVPAGVALFVVAFGGAVVLVSSRRALGGARA